MNEQANGIRLSGRVISCPVYDHTVFGEAFYRMEVAAARLSGTEDLLPVTVSERLLLRQDPPEEGAYVDISGQIRSYNQRSEAGSHLLITVFARELSFPDIPDEADHNEAELYGAVCKPVVYRTTPFSREIADLLIAVNRRYGKSDYLPCIAWGRNARFAGELQQGTPVFIRGRLQSRAYMKTLPDETREQRIAYEISISSIESFEA
ncbi:MAG: single-stranded DNA-binding protein [Clostridiales bacterium]|nr:single-stranded DNA-binding protein [Clostridiales bacterium]